MPMGAHAWRERLAKEEEKRRRQFGFDDIMDLLQTAYGVSQGIQGTKQAGAAQDLAREKFDYGKTQDEYLKGQDTLREKARIGGEMRDLEGSGYEQVPALTGGYGDAVTLAAGGEMGRIHPDLNQTAWRREPIPEPETREGLIPSRFDTDTRAWEYGNDPTYVHPLQQSQIDRNSRYPVGGDSLGADTLDLTRFQKMATEDAERWARVNGRVAQGIDGPGDVIWDADVDAVYNHALQGYQQNPPPPEDGGEFSPGAAYGELAMGILQQDPEALADYAEMQTNDPPTAAVIAMLLEAMQNQPQTEAGGSAIGGLFDTVNRGIDTYQNIRSLPGKAAELPGRVRAGAESANAAAWPLRTIFDLLR